MPENNRRRWTVLILAADLIVVVLLATASCQRVPVVRVVNVVREDLSATISTNGKVEPISPAVARAAFATFVHTVPVTEGQAVHRGQIVLTLDVEVAPQLAQVRAEQLSAQSDLRNAEAGGPPDEVAQLQGDIEKARENVTKLERLHRALNELVAKQAALQDELAQNQSSLAQARASLTTLEQKKRNLEERNAVDAERARLRTLQAQEQIRELDQKVRAATITSPVQGILYSLPVHAGDYVKAGDVLAEIADLRHVRVRVFVDEPDLGGLRVNQAVQVRWDAKPSRIWTGRTEQLPRQVVAHGTRSVGEVSCFVENGDIELLPNVNVEVQILIRERLGALVVPRAAVRYDEGNYFVFVYDGARIHRRKITVGVASATKYEVLSGLKSNDQVVLFGNVELRDGLDVRASETSPSNSAIIVALKYDTTVP